MTAIRAGKERAILLNANINKLLNNSYIELSVRWSLGVIFLYACYHKILAPAHFAKIIYGYYLFPVVSINLIAIVLPFIELFAGLAMILGIYPRSAVLIVNGMLMMFIFALSINLIRGVQFDCGCFSFGEAGYTYSAAQLLIRDIVFFVCGLQVLFFRKRRKLCLRQTGGILSANIL